MTKLPHFIIPFIIVVTSFSFHSQAQLNSSNSASRRLSITDSSRLKSYLEKVSYARLGSTKRQLFLDSALMIEQIGRAHV